MTSMFERAIWIIIVSVLLISRKSLLGHAYNFNSSSFVIFAQSPITGLLTVIPSDSTIAYINQTPEYNFLAELDKLLSSKALERLNIIFILESPQNFKLIRLVVSKLSKLSQNKSNDWFPNVFVYIKFPECVQGENLNNIVEQKIRIPFDSNFYILICDDRISQCHKFFEVYSIKEKTIMRQIELPQMSPREAFEKLVNGMVRRRKDFQQIPITGVSTEYLPSAHFQEFIVDGKSELKLVGGNTAPQFWFLRDALNFREKLVNWEHYNIQKGPNGTLTGLAVPVNSDIADLCFANTEFLSYLLEGPDRISLLHASFHAQMEALFVQPPLDSVRHLYAYTFTWDSWVALGFMWILLMSTASLGTVFYKNALDDRPPYSALVWVINCIALQGLPERIAISKEITTVGFFFGVIFFAAFSGNLVSLFTLPAVPIKSLADIIRFKYFIYSDIYVPSSAELVQSMQNHGMIPQLPEKLWNVDMDQVGSKLLKGSAMISAAGYLGGELVNKGLSPAEICSIYSTIDVSSEPVKMGMFVKRGSPFRKVFNVAISRMIECGVENRNLKQFFTVSTLKCLREKEKRISPVGIGDVFSINVIFLLGAILALGFLSVEIIFVKKRNYILLNKMWEKLP